MMNNAIGLTLKQKESIKYAKTLGKKLLIENKPSKNTENKEKKLTLNTLTFLGKEDLLLKKANHFTPNKSQKTNSVNPDIMPNGEVKKWWKEGVVYQIYPRSFLDTDGNGVGDLRGVINKLDYLKELGIDIVWLNPVYESPNADNGYDISDYKSIMKDFGTMKDWNELVEGLHKRGIKLVMDLVVNHTSDEHQWFVESKSSKDSPYRDYYIWRPGKEDGSPPNNWKSNFGGPAWTKDEKSGEYYLHLFSKKQPDLNWDNPILRQDVYDMMNWWFEKGVDGFRMDVINMISKPEGLPDEVNPDVDLGCYINGPNLNTYLKEMNSHSISQYNAMTVGECPGITPKHALKLAGKDEHELDMVFHYEHVTLDYKDGKRWEIGKFKPKDLMNVMSKWQTELDGKAWNSIYLTNHDQPRALSRFANDSPQFRELSGKLLATMVMTLKGTPYIYMGEEIGMTNANNFKLEDYRDIESVNYIKESQKKGIPDAEILDTLHYKSRDNSRTPFQWNDSKNAGFSSAQPWIKVNPNYTEINLEAELKDPTSIFHHYQDLIKLRKDNPTLVYGDFKEINTGNDAIYGYSRSMGDEKFVVLMNFEEHEQKINLPDSLQNAELETLLDSYTGQKADIENNIVKLKPYEAIILKQK